ncbi:3,4-dihydroxy-2-butanone-4-phosphate synthase [Actinomyces radicidentis]|uniref:3,4-dihydroxy-2-butanone-4-phosphate synthase n=1 Tax=Actinomyces radicidentis TaxID=111015 RepID=UPI000B0FF33E|nr:3,4-dihydroxy-2-butanone-4-phosphate synthase [Actinomyces radicidentis]
MTSMTSTPTAEGGADAPAGARASEAPGSSTSTRAVVAALATLAAGGMVVVSDDASRENEADLILGAATATTEQLGFMVRHSSGIICVPMRSPRLAELGIPMMTATNTDPHETAFTVSTDARVGVTTGISAADRARTIRLLAADGTVPGDLVHPGHVFPLRARPGGVLERRGHTEAAVDLVRMAGAGEVGVLVELVDDDGALRKGEEVLAFAAEHGLPHLTIEDIVTYRWTHERLVEEVVTTGLPTRYGTFTAHGFRGPLGEEVVVLTCGRPEASDAPLVRVHSGCLTGDVLGSSRCDCGAQLDEALRLLQEAGDGVLVYLPSHEGRGIGLLAKLRAYALQEQGLDTVDANLELGLPVDARRYGSAAQALLALGVDRVRLITNNPSKVTALRSLGIDVVGTVERPAHATRDNLAYLRAKGERMGHHLDLGDAADRAAIGSEVLR